MRNWGVSEGMCFGRPHWRRSSSVVGNGQRSLRRIETRTDERANQIKSKHQKHTRDDDRDGANGTAR